jgi:hypothetical protein
VVTLLTGLAGPRQVNLPARGRASAGGGDGEPRAHECESGAERGLGWAVWPTLVRFRGAEKTPVLTGFSLIVRPRPGWARRRRCRGKVTVALTWQLALPGAPAFGSFCLSAFPSSLCGSSRFLSFFFLVRVRSVCWIAGWREMDGRLWLVGGAFGFGRRWGGRAADTALMRCGVGAWLFPTRRTYGLAASCTW